MFVQKKFGVQALNSDRVGTPLFYSPIHVQKKMGRSTLKSPFE